ncbi:MAG: hypothetical protein Q9226_005530 [Calogaya cf. arnoldii]
MTSQQPSRPKAANTQSKAMDDFRCLANLETRPVRCPHPPQDLLGRFNPSQSFEKNVMAFMCGTHKHWFERQPSVILPRFKEDYYQLKCLLAGARETFQPKVELDSDLGPSGNPSNAPTPVDIALHPNPSKKPLPVGSQSPRVTTTMQSTGMRPTTGLREPVPLRPFRYDSILSRGNAQPGPATPRSQTHSPWPKNLHVKQGSSAMQFRQFQSISQNYWYTQGVADGRHKLFEDLRLRNPDKKLPDAAYNKFEQLYQQMENLISSFDDLD